ncbi:hypothetical protein MAPG_06992 [Magnaporthiopsis poae ATCC 64411]|uniref:Uncharacterized protein n=1 Tax=Magnaporthiopsis poae (strain ATCC 64411 / 73-15) TaxID=644358 RepID=A0A0C4E3J1_MAGP6|nr:hypothetical protein MAPG_06992 [Magnaporthiopsis poae ATCC 64411]
MKHAKCRGRTLFVGGRQPYQACRTEQHDATAAKVVHHPSPARRPSWTGVAALPSVARLFDRSEKQPIGDQEESSRAGCHGCQAQRTKRKKKKKREKGAWPDSLSLGLTMVETPSRLATAAAHPGHRSTHNVGHPPSPTPSARFFSSPLPYVPVARFVPSSEISSREAAHSFFHVGPSLTSSFPEPVSFLCSCCSLFFPSFVLFYLHSSLF